MLKNTKILYPVSFVIFLMVFLNGCKSSDYESKVRKIKPWDKLVLTPMDIEEKKAGKKNVKVRTTYTSMYNNFGERDTAKYLVEKLYFNRLGIVGKKEQYATTGELDILTTFEYENRVPSHIISKDKWDEILEERIVKFNDEGDEIEFKEYNVKQKAYNKILVRYNKAKLVSETIATDSRGNQISKQTFNYKNKRLVNTKEFGRKNELQKEIFLDYDSNGKLIKETKRVTGFKREFTKVIKYNKFGIEEINDNDFVTKYDYVNGRISKEHYSIIGTGPQRRFDYFYNKKGLVKTKVSVSGIGKPEIQIFYRYEYYE